LLALKLDVVTLPDCALWTVLTMPDATPMQGVVAVDSERLRYEVLALKDASPPHVWPADRIVRNASHIVIEPARKLVKIWPAP
jgi:hypothetical protein